jgi:hypothetical protein
MYNLLTIGPTSHVKITDMSTNSLLYVDITVNRLVVERDSRETVYSMLLTYTGKNTLVDLLEVYQPRAHPFIFKTIECAIICIET